jgi:hypothetical protein
MSTAVIAVLILLILDRPLCLDCIAAKSAITVSEAMHFIDIVAHWPLHLRFSDNRRCRICGKRRLVFSLQPSRN